MLPKTAADKESVDQKELVNVMLVFTWMIVQVSFRYVILFWIPFWPTVRAIVIKKNFFEFEVEGNELILRTDLFEQGMVRVIFETEYYLLGG